MQCTGCPYIKEDLDRMIDEYDEYPDSVYSEYEISEFLYKYYWCEKVGGKIYHYGVCSELEHNIKKHKSLSKQKRRNKRERDLKHKERLKQLDKISINASIARSCHVD